MKHFMQRIRLVLIENQDGAQEAFLHISHPGSSGTNRLFISGAILTHSLFQRIFTEAF